MLRELEHIARLVKAVGIFVVLSAKQEIKKMLVFRLYSILAL